MMRLLLAMALAAFAAVPAHAAPPLLAAPLACEANVNCFVQNHVDLDPGPGMRDAFCGAAGYDGHKGVDFRILPQGQPVPVLAAAAGIVKGARDGMDDVFVRDIGKAAVSKRECGNGVVIDHGEGWETQYCHMRKGSVRVQRGERVAQGAPLGDVGFSGAADFAHVHFSVRHDGKVVDPYTALMPGEACLADGSTAHGLWQDDVANAFAYRPGQFIETGFAAAPPELRALEAESGRFQPARADGGALVFFVRSINLRQGDRVRIVVTGPDGFSVETTSDPLERNKAAHISFAGKKLRDARWPAGTYDGHARLLRDNRVVDEAKSSFKVQ